MCCIVFILFILFIYSCNFKFYCILFALIVIVPIVYHILIGASLSEPHTYRTAVQNPPYIYIRAVRPSLRPASNLVPRRAPLNAQTSDRPVMIQRSIISP